MVANINDRLFRLLHFCAAVYHQSVDLIHACIGNRHPGLDNREDLQGDIGHDAIDIPGSTDAGDVRRITKTAMRMRMTRPIILSTFIR